MHQVIILACSRSGTIFTKDLLRNHGLDFGHEEIEKDGGIGWKIGTTVAVPDGCIVLHQVRNPISCIPTMMRHSEDMKVIIKEKFDIKTENDIEFAMEYWYKWNRDCSERAEWTYKVEDIYKDSDVLKKLKAIFDIKKDVTIPPKDTNTRRHKIKTKITINAEVLKDVNAQLADSIIELSNQFGYNIGEINEQ